MCAGVSVHQYSSWSGLRDLRSSEDPSGNLDRPVSGSPLVSGQTAVRSHQEHETPVGGTRGLKAGGVRYGCWDASFDKWPRSVLL